MGEVGKNYWGVFICVVVTHNFWKSLSHGVFTPQHKTAKITIVFKTGDESGVSVEDHI